MCDGCAIIRLPKLADQTGDAVTECSVKIATTVVSVRYLKGCEILGCYSGVAEDSSHVGYGALSFGCVLPDVSRYRDAFIFTG